MNSPKKQNRPDCCLRNLLSNCCVKSFGRKASTSCSPRWTARAVNDLPYMSPEEIADEIALRRAEKRALKYA